MQNIVLTKHDLDMIQERQILYDWIIETINYPDFSEFLSNNEVHYVKQIKEFSNRYLRVVVNPYTLPIKVVTVLFDRRLKNENKS